MAPSCRIGAIALNHTVAGDGFQKTEIMSTERELLFPRNFTRKKSFNWKWSDLTELVNRGNS
jgi:hypothetical protein